MSIRKRVFFLVLLILLYPLAGIYFLKENEKQFRESESLILKDRLTDAEKWIDFLRPKLEYKGNNSDDSLFFSPLESNIKLDGDVDVERNDIPKKIETDSKNEIQVSWQSAVFSESMYLLFSVKDERFQPQDNRSLLANGDHLGIRLGDNKTYYLRLGKPGKITPYYLNSIDNLINSDAIKGYWQPTKDGYRVEVKVDKKMTRGRLGFFVANASDKYNLLKKIKRDGPSSIVANLNTRKRLLEGYPVVNTELAPRYQLIDFSLKKILDRTVREKVGMRLHVVDKNCKEISSAGNINTHKSREEVPWLVENIYKLVLSNDSSQSPRPDKFDCSNVKYKDKVSEILEGKSQDIYWVEEYTNDLVYYAAMELSTDPYKGYLLIAEQGRDRYVQLTIYNFLIFLASFIGISIIIVSIILIAMTHWSNRLARLNDNAQRHVDEKGDITGEFKTDDGKDEIGQLSRNVGDLLGQIKSHNDYLKTLAQKLSHEMRTPLGIVSTSLDNIDTTNNSKPSENDQYLNRARDGVTRLTNILDAMGQAKKIEQAIEHADIQSFDIILLLKETCHSYQSVYKKNPIIFNNKNETKSLVVNASADLLVQMLDKLVDNAVGFSEEGSSISINFIQSSSDYEIQVINSGSQLPEQNIDNLFQQLVSYRGKGDYKPHLGLGLFIARLISEFHGGTITAKNLDDGKGVCFSVCLPFS